MSTATHKKSKLPEFFSLILIVVLGIIGAKLMWLVITPKPLTTNQAPSMSNSTIISKEKINYGKLIANHHLFGEVVVKKAAIVKTPTKTEEPKVAPTKLNLKLHGIVSYKSNSKKGYALISSSGKPQKVYGKGDELQKGVTVRDIFPDKVVLDNHGKTEDLILPVKNTKSSSSKKRGEIPPAYPASLGIQTAKKATDLDLGVFRQEVQKNPQKLLDIASPSPAIVNGKFMGFRLQPGRKSKLFRQLGFRPNDIITEVNGIILDDSSKGPMVLGELAQASELSITLKRGSQEIFIQHSF